MVWGPYAVHIKIKSNFKINLLMSVIVIQHSKPTIYIRVNFNIVRKKYNKNNKIYTKKWHLPVYTNHTNVVFMFYIWGLPNL